MPGIQFDQKQQIAVPERDDRMAIRRADWDRVRRSIRRLVNPLPTLVVWYSILFGVFAGTGLSVVPLRWAEGLPSWIVPFESCVAGGCGLLAIILWLLERKLAKSRGQIATELETDLDDIESLLKPEQAITTKG